MVIPLFFCLLLLHLGFGAGFTHGSVHAHAHTHQKHHRLRQHTFVHRASDVSASDTAPARGLYWYGDSKLRHTSAPAGLPDDYKVFRNVRDYGAKGDGITDDTTAIEAALQSGRRCSPRTGCTSSSVSRAVIYFPSGVYLVSHPLIMYYYTLLAGDPNNPATIKASPGFRNTMPDSDLIALIDSNPYNRGKPWFEAARNHFQQIRNLRLDTTAVSPSRAVIALHWQNSQASSIQNVEIVLASGNSQHIGIQTDDGSGAFVSDVAIRNGNIGWQVASQHFAARNISFANVMQAAIVRWSWGSFWKSMRVRNAYKAIELETYDVAKQQGSGSATIMDSTFENSQHGISLSRDTPPQARPAIVLDNLAIINDSSVISYTDNTMVTILDGGKDSRSASTIPMWAMGLEVSTVRGRLVDSAGAPLRRPSYTAGLKSASGAIFERSKPSYADFTLDQVVNVGDYVAQNADKDDQRAAINAALREAVKSGKLVFFPSGIYKVNTTLFIPSGSRIVGEAWSQIIGVGPAFADEFNTRPVVKVGNIADRGLVEISDMMIGVQGALPGAVLLQWNMAERAQGSAGMWDVHFRVGGVAGSELGASDCPVLQAEVPRESCKSVSLALHLTPQSSGYFENMWLSAADWDLDATSVNRSSQVFAGRGLLIESQGPTWLYGVSVEHFALYQATLLNTQNVFIGMLHTESPAYQPRILPTRVVSNIGAFPGDPGFEECNDLLGVGGISVSPNGKSAVVHQRAFCERAWGLSIVNSQDIFAHSLGLYSFYSDYQKCSDPPSAQEVTAQNNEAAKQTNNAAEQLLDLFTKGPIGSLVSGVGGVLSAGAAGIVGIPGDVIQILTGQGLGGIGQLINVISGLISPSSPPPIKQPPPSNPLASLLNGLAPPRPPPPASRPPPKLDPKAVQPIIAGALAVLQSSWNKAAEAGICQDRIFEISNSDRIWVYNVFATGVREAISPAGMPGVPLNETVRRGYTGEIAAFLGFSGNNTPTVKERWLGQRLYLGEDPETDVFIKGDGRIYWNGTVT